MQRSPSYIQEFPSDQKELTPHDRGLIERRQKPSSRELAIAKVLLDASLPEKQWQRALWSLRTAMCSEQAVYFVQPVGGGLVKIGTSSNVILRMPQLQSASPIPLRLIGIMPGNTHVEKLVHKKFAHLRQHGEWFKARRELGEFIRMATSD